METVQTLQAKHSALLSSFHDHLDAVHNVQDTLLNRILPNVLEDVTFNDAASIHRSREWIMDTGSIFRMYKRHKFTATFALEALRDLLLWRLNYFSNEPVIDASFREFIHCSPSMRDAFGRPVIVVHLSALIHATRNIIQTQQYVLYTLEILRSNLTRLSSIDDTHSDRSDPVLQCVLLLDLEGASVRALSIELLTWYMNEAMPRFPGLFAAAFFLNSSWAQTGIWTVLKHALPDVAMSRIFFLTRSALSVVIPPSALSRDHGGELPPLAELVNMLAFPNHGRRAPSPSLTITTGRLQRPSLELAMSPLSSSNPYFGYPNHERRRKRDLAYTLTILFWKHWRSRLLYAIATCLAIVLLRSRGRIFPRR